MFGQGKKAPKIGILLATLALGAGLAATTPLAEAETGASIANGDLANLLEEKLEQTRRERGPRAANLEATTAVETAESSVDVAAQIALVSLVLAALVFGASLWIKRAKERSFGAELGALLSVTESVWIGRGQRLVLVSVDSHKVLVGVSGGALHSLGVFDEGGKAVSIGNPIERAAAMRDAEGQKTSEFSEFVKGELAGGLSGLGAGRDRRRKMISDLNTL